MIGELLVASPRILENPVKAHIQVGGAAETLGTFWSEDSGWMKGVLTSLDMH